MRMEKSIIYTKLMEKHVHEKVSISKMRYLDVQKKRLADPLYQNKVKFPKKDIKNKNPDS
jgi:hypothetical protein